MNSGSRNQAPGESAGGRETEDLLTLWRDTVRAAPSRIILHAEGRSWTRAELDGEVREAGRRLLFGQAVKGSRVALAERNGPGWFAGFLSILRAGGIPVLLDHSEDAQRLIVSAKMLRCSHLWRDGTLVRLEGRPIRARRAVCLLKVTSGSTGLPRGLAFTHGQMIADGRQICAGMGINESDTNLGVIPLGHSYGLGNLVMPLLVQGTALACVGTPLPRVIAAQCAASVVTVFPAVPALLRALSRSGLAAGDLAPLRLVISAGAPIAPLEARAFRECFGLRVNVFYGSSETGGISYDATGGDAEAGLRVGRALPGVSITSIRGGRLRVSSPAVFGRGSHSPADSAEIGPDGTLALTGRVGRMVKVAGRRLDLSGFELELGRLPGVRGVVASAHPEKPEALAVLVASDLDVRSLRLLLVGHLPSWKLPERIRVVEELPLTQRGKVDRTASEDLLRLSVGVR